MRGTVPCSLSTRKDLEHFTVPGGYPSVSISLNKGARKEPRNCLDVLLLEVVEHFVHTTLGMC